MGCKDDIVVWTESSYLFAYCNGEKEIENLPTNYRLKVSVYQNILGGVNAYVDGEFMKSNMPYSHFEIYGNRVLVKMFNNSFIVLENGKQYTN